MVFRIAHLSDLHHPITPVPTMMELAGKRLTGHINWTFGRGRKHQMAVLDGVLTDIARHQTDQIAVTGDLINLGLAAEYAPARLLLERLGPAQNVALVCGNHDAYIRRTADLIREHWGEWLLARRPQIGVRKIGKIALIGLDSAVPTAPFLATGSLGRQQREALRTVLAECRSEGLVRVILIHHPPFSISPTKRLTDGRFLRQILKEEGAELVLHGHTHHGTITSLAGRDGPVAVVGVPSASMGGGHEPAGWNLLTLSGHGRDVVIDVERRAIRGLSRRPVRIFEKRVRG